jgi:hypothetical protein
VVGGADLDPDVCWRFPVLGVGQHWAICRIYSSAKRMLLFWATLVALALGHSRSEPAGRKFLPWKPFRGANPTGRFSDFDRTG